MSEYNPNCLLGIHCDPYFSLDSDNYYCSVCKQGMGNAYYIKRKKYEKQQVTIDALRTEIEYYEDMVKALCCSGVIVKTYAEKDTVTDFEKLWDSIDEALEES